MIRIKKSTRIQNGSGVVWPITGTTTLDRNITDVFGPRPFAPHVPTVGYDYDFHRGVDVTANNGDTLYSPINGFITRKHYTHFFWEHEDQLNEFTEVDTSSALTASIDTGDDKLDLVSSGVGTQTFLTAAHLRTTALFDIDSDDADIQIKFETPPTGHTSGYWGIAFYDDVEDEYAYMEFRNDGAPNAEILSRVVGTSTSSLSTTNLASFSGNVWLRILHDVSDSQMEFYYSTDGESWTNTVNVGSSGVWTRSGFPAFRGVIYWRSTSASGTGAAEVDFFGAIDNNTIGRFGNWVMIQKADEKWLMMHMGHLFVNIGDSVVAGDRIGTVSKTGFDDRSGRILTQHIHFEYIQNNSYFYDNDDPVNPLGIGIFPRDNVNDNVSVVRTTENDPNGDTSWKLRITIDREDQDFDFNQVSLTGNLATRTVNFNTRSGLNTDTDVPDENGVYIVAQDFDTDSTSYVVDFFFQKSVVGTTFTSAEIRDTAGTVVWSE